MFGLKTTVLGGSWGCVCVLSSSVVSDSLWPPWIVAHQAPLSMGFSRKEYWSGLPFPPPGDLPDPGIKPKSLVAPALAGGFFTTEQPRKPRKVDCGFILVSLYHSDSPSTAHQQF